jgi:hypothetical protein
LKRKRLKVRRSNLKRANKRARAREKLRIRKIKNNLKKFKKDLDLLQAANLKKMGKDQKVLTLNIIKKVLNKILRKSIKRMK